MQGHDGVFFFGDPMFPSLSIGGHVVPLVVLDDRLSDYCGVEIEAHHTYSPYHVRPRITFFFVQ